MLDIGFSELVVIGVVALIVIGPERLPRVARTAGHLLGRFQRYVAEVKADINREMELAELKKLQSSVEDAARSIEHSVKSGMEDAEKEFRSAQAALEDTGAELKKTEDALKQAVTGVQLPHMGTATAAQEAQPSGNASLPPTTDVSAPMSATDSPANIPLESPTELSPAAARHGSRSEDDSVSPQMELALDPGGELTTRRQV